MARLIDADALMEECLNHYEVGNIEQNCTMDWICKTVRNFPTAPRWHRVEDELPSMDGYDWVLGIVTGEAGYHRFHKAVMMVSFDPQYKEWFIDEYQDAKITVSHWMELPEAPKEMDDAEAV